MVGEHQMATCRICNNTNNNQAYTAREMLLGYRNKFEYFECSQCGCLQIKEVPSDLRRYYPSDCFYYEPRASSAIVDSTKGGVSGLKAHFIKEQITKYYLNKRGFLGGWLEKRSCLARDYPHWMKMGRVNLGLGLKSSVLDVGCGTGPHLLDLRASGLSNLTGLDPFIEEDIVYPNGVKILKGDLESLNQQFDFIMMHHAFEHVPDPLLTLKKLYDLLKPSRYILIRIPVAASYGWKKYGVDWVLLDAPRHLFLHTTKSMKILAAQSGLEVANVVYDSDGCTFWASEQYIRDIPLTDSKSYFTHPSDSIFSKEQIELFDARAAELNEKGEGDSAGFYLYRRK